MAKYPIFFYNKHDANDPPRLGYSKIQIMIHRYERA